MYQPKTSNKCFCKKGMERDNCPSCEGTGLQIDFKAIREQTKQEIEPIDDAPDRDWNS